MSRFKTHEEFEQRFDSMEIPELERWKIYWLQHSQHLAPNVQKLALHRIHKIVKAIHAKLSEQE